MAHYTNVRISIAGSRVATATRAELGVPGAAHRYVVTGLNSLGPGRSPWLRHLDQDCLMTATGPAGTTVNIDLHISGIKSGGDPLHLD